MSIAQVDVIVTSPGRNFVTVKITTSEGIVGWGDGTLNGRELAVVSYLRDHVAPTLIGRDEDRIEDTWQYLYRSPYWRRGPVTMASVAAVDTALWDIKAKKAGMPLYQLLGGASRSGLRAYMHAAGASYDELLDAVHRLVEQGMTAIRVQVGIPGLGAVYGVAGSGAGAPPAHDTDPGAGPEVEIWDTRAYLGYIPTVFRRLRDDLGPTIRLLHDSHHRLTPIEAARLARDLEPYDLFWLEDCTPAEDQSALRLIRSASVTPLATGEVFNTVFDYQTLFTERLIDYARSSVTHAGGVTGLKRILDFAGVYGVKSGIHGPEDVSPIGMAAGLHIDLAIHNFGIQEYTPYSEATRSVFRTSYTIEDGYLHPGDKPGLGVDFDEEMAALFPYEPDYLPISRLTDGTQHDW